MAESESPYRVNAPNPRLFTTSEGEQGVLRQITPENIGGMYGLLFQQQSQAEHDRNTYGTLLDAVNRQQERIAGQKLAQETQEANQKFLMPAIEHGHLPVSAALQLGGMGGMVGQQGPGQIQAGVLEGDRLRALATRARAMEQAGTGLQRGVEAGLRLDPGQAIRGPEQMVDPRMHVERPLDLDLEALRNAGQASRQASQDGMYTFQVNPLNGETAIIGKGRDPAEVSARVDAARQAYIDRQQTQTANNGGNLPPPSAGAAARPVNPPPPNPVPVPQLTPQAGQRQAAEVIQRNPKFNRAVYRGMKYVQGEGNYMRFQMPDGSMQEVPARTK